MSNHLTQDEINVIKRKCEEGALHKEFMQHFFQLQISSNKRGKCTPHTYIHTTRGFRKINQAQDYRGFDHKRKFGDSTLRFFLDLIPPPFKFLFNEVRRFNLYIIFSLFSIKFHLNITKKHLIQPTIPSNEQAQMLELVMLKDVTFSNEFGLFLQFPLSFNIFFHLQETKNKSRNHATLLR